MLVDIPCQYGDTAYGVRRYRGQGLKIMSGEISEIGVTDRMEVWVAVKGVCRGQIGKNIFLNKEAAEKKLEELNQGRAQ